MAHVGLVYLPLLELGIDNGTQHTAGCGGMHAFFHTSNRFRNNGVLVFSKAKHYVFFHTSNRFKNNGVLVFSK